MRTLGPGSVSSFLKIVVDVIYAALCVGAAVLLAAGLALLVVLPFTGPLVRANVEAVHGAAEAQALRLPALPLAVLAMAAYALGLVVVFNRLRRVFATLTLGDPFHPDNVTRLRVIGLALIVLEGLGWLLRLALAMAIPHRAAPGVSLNLTAWFAILVVFVLAEVFREGARLRQEAELTI